MDFGFGTFLEKFEEYFGRVATRLLLFLIGLGVAAVCISLVMDHAVRPVLTAIANADRDKHYWEAIGSVSSPLSTLLLIVMGAVVLSSDLLKWRERWEMRKLRALLKQKKAQYDELKAELRSEIDRSTRLGNQSKELLTLIRMTVDDAIDVGLRSGSITEAQADEIRSLRNNVLGQSLAAQGGETGPTVDPDTK